MKHFNLIILFLSIISLKSFAQIEKPTIIEIDKTVFTDELQGSFYSNDKKAVLISYMSSENFDKLVAELSNLGQTAENDIETGYIDGTNIFFTSEIEERNGKKYLMFAFLKKVKNNLIINISSGFPLKDKDIYYQVVIDAVKSAKVN